MTIIIEKATIKMKNLLKYILLLIYVALMPACGEDSGLDGVLANKPFALVTAADGGRTSISAVIDDGKVVEYGSYQELMRKKGEYYKLYQIQAESLKYVGIGQD